MLNTICKPSSNGTRCANCEMQSFKDHGVNYIKIRPKTNEDLWRSQIVRRVNVTPINDISMRGINLSLAKSDVRMKKYRQKKYELCGVNCYQNHNLMSSFSLMPLYFEQWSMIRFIGLDKIMRKIAYQMCEDYFVDAVGNGKSIQMEKSGYII